MIRKLKSKVRLWIGKGVIFLNRDKMAGEQKLPKGCFANSFYVNAEKSDEKICIVPVGEFPEHPDGPHIINKEHLEQMLKNQKTDVMIDMGHEAIWSPSAPAFGWIAQNSLEVRDDGLYGDYPEFTPDADQLVQDRKYRFLSPAYTLMNRDKQGKQIGAKLYPIALTNRPYMDEEISHLRNSQPNQPENTMSFTDEQKEKMGLTKDATDAEAQKKFDELIEAGKGAPAADGGGSESEGNGSESGDGTSEGEGAAAKENSAVEKRLDALEKEREEAKKNAAESMVDAAISQFKIVPAQKQMWLNSATLDYEGTKKQLDEIKVNSVKPQATPVPGGDDKDDEVKKNSVQSAAEYFKSAGRQPLIN